MFLNWTKMSTILGWSKYRKSERWWEVERSVAEVRRDRARALARVSFGIGAAFICMHQAGKNKRIRACVSGALFVIQFVTRGVALFHERNASLLLGSQGRGSDSCLWTRNGGSLLFTSRKTFSPRKARNSLSFLFFSGPLFKLHTHSRDFSYPILDNCASNAAELLISCR